MHNEVQIKGLVDNKKNEAYNYGLRKEKGELI